MMPSAGCVIFFLSAACALAASDGDFFETRVRPLLASNCYACHTNSKLGGLRLDSHEAVIKGGASGPAIVPGAPDDSLMIQAVRHTHKRLKMPPAGKLNDAQIADLARWIQGGAVWPAAQPAGPVSAGNGLRPEQRAFWSFAPLRLPPDPVVKNSEWPKGSVDRFILAALESRAMTPARRAAARALIRRSSFDLTGLPPTPQEVDAFVRDSSPAAFAKVVDRLLASPQFGERWARYWLDVAAYGEDDARGGGSTAYPNAWRYRDWVVHSFNGDMRYDVFVKAQIAGDLMEAPEDRKLKPGLGYLATGPWGYEVAAPAVARANERDARIDAITRGFLGLTVACARCHDHKYDPISNKDYYALAGIYASTDYREYPLAPPAEIEAFERRQAKIQQKKQQLDDFLQTFREQLMEVLSRRISSYMMAAWKAKTPDQVEQVAATKELDAANVKRWIAYLTDPKPREHSYLDEWRRLMKQGAGEAEMRRAADKFQDAILQIAAEKKKIDQYNKAVLLVAKNNKPVEKPIGPNGYKGLNVDEEKQEGKSLEIRQFLVWSDMFAPVPPPFGVENRPLGLLNFEDEALDRFMSPAWKQNAAALRAELAELKKSQPKQYPVLMGFEESPTPGNMKVNLRGNPYNFGDEAPRRFVAVLSEGEPQSFKHGSGRLELAEAIVSHPLAARVMANRIWQRLFGFGIVRSASNFGQVGDRPTHPELLEYLAARLKNNWSTKSLIREIMLSAAYQMSSDNDPANAAKDPENKLLWRAHARRLDVEAMRDAILAVSGKLDPALGGPSADLKTGNYRRTLYARISRHRLDEQLALFDFPNAEHSSEYRESTNVPLQRLFYLNSDFLMSNAAALVERLKAEVGPDERGEIRAAYRLLYGRQVTDAELNAGAAFLAEAAQEKGGDTSPWQRYAQVLLASNEFSYLD
jgi:mono/diheme cytochrome c family protein